MAQQPINIGTVANDGTGDPLRTAFGKTNNNVTELYASVASNASAIATKADNATTNAALAAKVDASAIDTDPTFAANSDSKVASQKAVRAAVREKLTSNRTYYVRADGSDSNDGGADTSGSAFLTIQKAVDSASRLDIAGVTVTIQLGDGTYTAPVTLKNVVGFSAPGNLVIQGNAAAPANVILSVASSDIITSDGLSSVWDIKNLKLTGTVTGSGIVAKNGATVRYGNIDFGAVASVHLLAFNAGRIVCLSNYTVSGGANVHWQSYYNGIITASGFTVTISGSPTFTSGWVYCSSLGIVDCYGMTFSGAASGARYNVFGNAVIFTNSGGSTYLPGSTAGSSTTGGQYI